jgi:hypothetical protein
MKRQRYSSAVILVLLLAASGALPAAAQIQVDSANPSAAPQGTTNLNVVVTGNGFKKGAVAQWFVTGTTNPGGVIVNSTTFKNPTQITANITVASDAVINGFDIVVRNADGRTGKGTDKFAVTQKGTPIGCSTTGTPSGFSLVTVLNPVQPNGTALIQTLFFGNAMRVRPIDLNRDGVVDSLVAFVTSGTVKGGQQGAYVFFLNPATGQVQPTNPVTGAAWQNPLLVLTGVRAVFASAGDVNGDGIPDFTMAIPPDNTAYLFVGSVNQSTFNPNYAAYPIQPPAGAPSSWAQFIAMGDLDGDGNDEVVVSAFPGRRESTIASMFIFRFAGGNVILSQTIQNPPGTGAGLGNMVAIGNIDGTPGNELVVGAPGASTPNGGAVYVFPSPLQQSSYFSITGPGPLFGRSLGIADANLDGSPDLAVVAGDQFSGSDLTAKALLFAGPVHAGATYTNQLLPATGNAYSFGAPNTDMGDMLSAGALLVGAPNSGCTGSAQLFTSPFSSTTTPNYLFEPPTLVGGYGNYGYGVAVAPGYPFILVGDKLRDVGTTVQAGQVYVYMKN